MSGPGRCDGLPSRVAWDGAERAATAGEIARAEGTAARVRREVGEIRAAADELASGTSFEAAVAVFLNAEATVLERNGGTVHQAAHLASHQDTRDQDGMLPTSARSALLVARAHLGSARASNGPGPGAS
ncbi:hypothetical protein [Streptomyces alboflavus]|uniref:hypothetical protein n=1 Tax=Streptomyces alboflavus TaxID=67267 RepID=UPI000F656AD3|nr:hypothetical protein [Streptomyces alboflavus]